MASGKNGAKEQPLVLTVREVARLLRIHRPKVYELIKDGSIDGVKVGADWRIKRASVENLVGKIPDGFFSDLSEEEQAGAAN